MRIAIENIVVIGLLSVAASGVAHTAEHIAKRTFVEHASDVITDIGAKGDSVGDILTFASDVYDETNTKLVGHDNGWCVRTVVGKAWECLFTLRLNDGEIATAGPFLDAGDSMWAITGGTGAYRGIRGEMKLHSRNEKNSEYDLIYSLMQP